jgi:class 3 adenylate cyclase/pimeloyl-ACP methyl ester carboxylesterase
VDVPDVEYARSAGDVAIAYQVVGDGDRDLVVLPFLANIWSLWTLLRFGPFAQLLATNRRLIVVNPRGVGLSDRPRGFTIESRMDDVRAAMDAAGSERAAILGLAESAATAAVFAASYPARVDSLLLFCPWLRGVSDEAARDDAFQRIRAEQDRWGRREVLEEMARALNPQWADDREYLDGFVWHHRLTASPAAFADFRRMQLDLDISNVLPAIRVPTLVMAKQRVRDAALEVAQRISDAQFVEIPGQGLAIWENEFALEAIEAFLGGGVPRRVPDTVLATLLFVDLVGSTERAAELGDRAWRAELEEHRAAVRRELERYQGEELDTAGDGFFARFHGPARAIAGARAILDANRALGLDLRAGIHTGECEIVDGKPAGLSVHLGSRVASLAGAGEVLVSGTVKDLVAGSGIEFEERGEHELKGVPGTWRLYAVAG